MFNYKEEFDRFVDEFKNYPAVSKEDIEGFYTSSYQYFERLSDDLYNKFCKTNTPHKRYVDTMIHEAGSFAGNVLNNFRNYFFYLKNDIRRAEEIKHKIFHNLKMFYILIESLDYFKAFMNGEDRYE